MSTELVFQNNDYRWGFHISIAGFNSWVEVFNKQLENPLRSYQIYLINGHCKRKPKFDVKDILDARKNLKLHQKYLCIHASLLYNPCGSKDYTDDPDMNRKWTSTLECLTAELDMGVGLGAGVVLHIGSCKYRKEGIAMIIKTLEYVLSHVTDEAKMLSREMNITTSQFISMRKVILENAAGEGAKIGSTLEEIAEIIDAVDAKFRQQVVVCLDTAHLCGYGQYDAGDPESLDILYRDFDELIGLEKLELFHLNDSKVPLGSKKDRHESLGLGYIFGPLRKSGDEITGLRYFFEQARIRCIPLISETPGSGFIDWLYVHEEIVSLED